MVNIARVGIQLICKEDKNYEYCRNLYDLIGGYANHAQIDRVKILINVAYVIF